MAHRVSRIAALLTQLIVAFCVGAYAQDVDITLNDRGLASLTYNGWDFIDNGEFDLWDNAVSRGYDASAQRITLTYSWGTLSCSYAVSNQSWLTMQIIAHNTSAVEAGEVGGILFALRTPVVADFELPYCAYITCQDDGPHSLSWPHWCDPYNDKGPGVVRMGFGTTGAAAFCLQSDPLSKKRIGIPTTFGSNDNYRFEFHFDEPIAAGAYDTLECSLRFGPSSAGLKDLADDIYYAFSDAYYYRNTWPDRRPVARDMVGGSGSADNPHGWFNTGNSININTPDGLEALWQAFDERAVDDIARMQRVGAQGVIVWDIEGDEYPHPITYIGDPRMVDTLATELNYTGTHDLCVVDNFFKRFRDAGFRVGVCIRPQRMTPDGGGQQLDVDDPAEQIYQKVTYARDRWGCTLYYMDSNVHDDLGWPIPSSILLTKTLDAYPDVLIMGEWETTKYFAYGAPYDGGYTQDWIREVYPQAFSAVVTGDMSPTSPNHLAAARKGDIQYFSAWWDAPENEAAQNSASAVGARPTVSVATPSDQSTVAPGPIEITSQADDADGSVLSVEYFDGSRYLGQGSGSSFSYAWENPDQRTHRIYAKATDNNGVIAWSAPVVVTVSAEATVSPPCPSRGTSGKTALVSNRTPFFVYDLRGRTMIKTSNASTAVLPSGVFFVRKGNADGFIGGKIAAVK